MKHRRAPRIAAAVAGVLVTAVAAAAFLNSAPGPPRTAATASSSSRRGRPLARIAERLADERLHPLAAAAAASWRGCAGPRATSRRGGTGSPRAPRTLRVHDLLVTGSQSLVKLTIPEGWTVSRIAALVEERGIAPGRGLRGGGRFRGARRGAVRVRAKTLEGFLYPDTYFVPAPFPGRDARAADGRDVLRAPGRDRARLAGAWTAGSCSTR